MAEYEEEFEVDGEGHTDLAGSAERVPEGGDEYGEDGFDEGGGGQSPTPGHHREESLKAHYARLLAGIESSTGIQTASHTSVGVQSQGLPCSDRGVQYPEDYATQGSLGVSEEQAVLRRLDTRVGQQRFTQFLRAATDAMECALEGGRVESALHPAALAARRQGGKGLGGAVPSVATLCPPPPPQTLAAAVAASFPHLPESTWALLTACRTPTALAQSPTRPGDFCCAFGPPPLPVREAWAKGVHVGRERAHLWEAPQGALSSPSSLVGVWTGPKVVPWRGAATTTATATATAVSEEGKALASLAPPPTFVLMARGVTVTSLAFSPGGDVVVGGTQEGLVCVWALGEPNWMHPTLVSTLEGGGGGGDGNTVTQGIHYPTGVRLPSVILTAPSNASGGGGGGGGAVVVQVCALVRDTKASLTTAAVEEARVSGGGRRGGGTTATAATGTATASASPSPLPLRRSQQHLKTGAGLCTLLPEFAAVAAAAIAASSEGDENRGSGQVSEQPEKQQQQQKRQWRQQSPLATLQYTPLPSFKTAASGAAWTPSSPPGTPHPPHTFQFLVACQDGSLTSYVALPMDLPKNDIAESMRHLSVQQQGSTPAAATTTTASAAAAAAAVSGVGGVSLGVLANTSGDTGRAPTGCIRVVQGDTTRVPHSGYSNSNSSSSSGSGNGRSGSSSTASQQQTTTTSVSPSPSDTRLTLVGHPGGKVSHVHRHATGDLFIQPSPTTFQPHHGHGHTAAQWSGGDATVITHNPLLTTLFAVGYSHGGGIAVFSTHHSLPLMTCTDPWAGDSGASASASASASAGGPPTGSILCISWVRERPHTLIAVSREGGVALWDLSLVCAPPASTPSGGEVPPHCVLVPPPPTHTAGVERGGVVVSAVCSGGSGLHPYTLSPVSIILAHASGQITALALHPAWYLPEVEPEGEVGKRLAGMQRALEG